MSEGHNLSRKLTNACQHCRARKVKCSGTPPCNSCRRRREECIFAEDRRISVSRREFVALKRKISQIDRDGERHSQRRKDSTPELGDEHLSSPKSNDARSKPIHQLENNLLVSPPSFVKREGQRQHVWFYQGPTSSWSFTHRILKSLAKALCPDTPLDLPIITDRNAYQVQWTKAQSNGIADITALPSQDHAIYLVNTVNFHIGHFLHLYDDEEFMKNLDEFYGDVQQKVQKSKLWYIQFLVVMAFGETLLLPASKTSQSSACSQYFTRAMSLLPDITEMWNDPILSVELLALVALYLYSLDMRDSSCGYIGQAMRIALIEGFHRALPVELEPKLASRCTNIWWSVYIMDIKFSASVGVPSSVRDEDVTAHLWDPMISVKRAAGISLHVKVSQVMSRVLNNVYSVDNKIHSIYLHKAQSALSRMADLSREWEEVFEKRFQSPADAVSGITTRLNLSYHLCVIIIVRPLILSLVVERVESLAGGVSTRQLSPSVRTLIETCVDSAKKSVKILAVLHDKNLLQTFLPFDLENIFASLFTLKVVSAILPQEFHEESYRVGKAVLEDLCLRENRIALFRQRELDSLEYLINLIPATIASSNHEPCDPAQDTALALEATRDDGEFEGLLDHGIDSSGNDIDSKTPDLTMSGPDLDEHGDLDWFHEPDGVGLMSEQILSVINQLDVDDLLLPGSPFVDTENWFWNAT
ncbi:Fungal transcriptional regulatory protein, N-terminal [Penicillium camemberti]|uniref:Fungal transcriptional regulatory protein, N-terminal n=1 Tax=Penicillium camemberti (strain FM 013) TaxID=1429867 RepID=A0A0G4P0V1_PENC3|nr:Fungal transcriptional regulatory protein, N-terminal [Penicillium camemberti]